MTLRASHRFAAALGALPGMGPGGLRLLWHHHAPDEAWAVALGTAAPSPEVQHFLERSSVALAWRTADRNLPDLMEERCSALAVQVYLAGDPGYPTLVGDDPQAPVALFAKGDLSVLERRRVGVIGTRHATATGRATAAELARGLSEHGVAVVSGLARGIDGAAHRAVVAADGAPVGVVASGLDVVYPREHAELWHAVAAKGVLMSEAPPGVRPEAFRFPLRNRILAMLSEVLVVVESRGSGGSLITADEAARRGRTVMAVPGSVRNPAAEGTNDLLADGATPARDLTDVLVALGLGNQPSLPVPHVAPLDGLSARLDRLLGDGGRSLDDLVRLSGQPLADVARALARLEATNLVVVTDGWYEQGHAPWGRT